ncbi:MAG TPA: COX15/CtaA family protein [Gaiellales bacterium]|jgi:cytochrome c oxidase assembly protein subunit 15|nr:COX15/CtaA family protein [Gaiellales bacterium]
MRRPATAPAGLGRVRLRRPVASTGTLRGATAATLGLLWLVVTTGALVRLTASGLGCPHWPTCDADRLLPAGSYHAVIEFTNRTISGVAMLSAVLTAAIAYRVRGRDAVTTATAIAAAGTVAQVPLGAVTVAFDLNPILVMSHFLLAMAVVVFATWATVMVWRPRRQPVRWTRPAFLAWGAAAACLVLVTTGAFVTAAGPHPGSTSTPIERLGDFYWATWVHVRAAAAFGILFAALAVWLWRHPGDRLARRLVALGIALTAVQYAVGEYQYRNGLPWQVIAVHVALAATLLVTVVAAAAVVDDGG